MRTDSSMRLKAVCKKHIENPKSWVEHPVLALKRRRNHGPPDRGFIIADEVAKNGEPTVYMGLVSLLNGVPISEQTKLLERTHFVSIEAMLDAGWEVD